MTFEQDSMGTPAAAVPSRVRSALAGDSSVPTPVAIRLQILTAEHQSLLASRGLAWTESFSRAAMFLSTLSGSIVALSLIGGVDGFRDAFIVVALVVLPVDLFVGIGTWLRMGATNYHDAVAVAGMNRIRAAYLEIAPDLGPYFVMGVHDDPPGIGLTMAVPPGTATLVHLIAGTPTLVMVLNGVLAGAITALVLIRFASPDPLVTLPGALVVATAVLLGELTSARGKIRRGQQALQPMFPTPPSDERPQA